MKLSSKFTFDYKYIINGFQHHNESARVRIRLTTSGSCFNGSFNKLEKDKLPVLVRAQWEIKEHLEQVPSIYPEIISATESWIKLHKPELTLNNEHFYLEGHYLDIFTKFVITQSFKTIIVVNPFIDRSMPLQLLVKAKRMGKTVVIVTRHSFKPQIKKLHEWLTNAGIKLLYHKNLHAARAYQSDCSLLRYHFFLRSLYSCPEDHRGNDIFHLPPI